MLCINSTKWKNIKSYIPNIDDTIIQNVVILKVNCLILLKLGQVILFISWFESIKKIIICVLIKQIVRKITNIKIDKKYKKKCFTRGNIKWRIQFIHIIVHIDKTIRASLSLNIRITLFRPRGTWTPNLRFWRPKLYQIKLVTFILLYLVK